MNYTADHEALRVALEAAGLFPTKCSLSGHLEKQPDGSMLPVGTVTFTQEATEEDKLNAQNIIDLFSKKDWIKINMAKAEIQRLEGSITSRILRDAALGDTARLASIEALIQIERLKL